MNAIQVFERKDLSVSATSEIRAQIEQALESTALIGAVSDVESNAKAADAIGQLKAIAATIEKARKAIKEPVLELGRAIDAKAKELSQELVVEMNRIGKAVTDWQTEQMEKQRAAERLRQQELERIERERREAEEKAERERQEAIREANRKAAEEAAKARNEQERQAAEQRRLEAEARALRDAEEAKQRAEQMAKQDAMATAAPVTKPKAQGQVVKEEYEFEMTNPFDLVRTHPGLVEITLRRAEAKAAIEALARTGAELKIPGLRIWKAVKVQQRATKNAVIEV